MYLDVYVIKIQNNCFISSSLSTSLLILSSKVSSPSSSLRHHMSPPLLALVCDVLHRTQQTLTSSLCSLIWCSMSSSDLGVRVFIWGKNSRTRDGWGHVAKDCGGGRGGGGHAAEVNARRREREDGARFPPKSGSSSLCLLLFYLFFFWFWFCVWVWNHVGWFQSECGVGFLGLDLGFWVWGSVSGFGAG